MTTIEEYTVKTLISKNYPSPFAWANYKLNPYRGCFHDCKYCDGRSEKYNMHEDFSTNIKVKSNAAELFIRFCKNKGLHAKSDSQFSLFNDELIQKEQNLTIFIASGVCDPYEPAESKFKITKQLLQIAYDYGVSVHILTKSALVLRDIDLLKKINNQSYAGVHFSISLADDKDQKIIEPGASSTTKRFTVLKKFRKELIPSGIYFLPILPFLSDSDKSMKTVYDRAVKADASFVFTGGLTLKPGRNKQVFFDTLNKHYPQLVEKYKKLYGNNHKYGIVDSYQMKLLGLIRPEVRAFKYTYENKMPYLVPRHIPNIQLGSNLKLAELFAKIAYLKNTVEGAYQEAKMFGKTAYFFENLKKDIFSTNKEEIQQMPVSKAVYPYLIDFFNNGKSTMLDDVEKEMYKGLIIN